MGQRNLEVAEAVAGPAIRIEKEMVREAVSKMKKGKAIRALWCYYRNAENCR